MHAQDGRVYHLDGRIMSGGKCVHANKARGELGKPLNTRWNFELGMALCRKPQFNEPLAYSP
jgi:hypothetical protein